MRVFDATKTLRLSIVEGSLSQIFLLWTTGSVLTGYMLYYQASPSQIALVSSVPLLSQLFSPLAAWWASKLTQRRVVAASFAFIGRILWLLAAFAPQLGVSAAFMPWFLILLVGSSSVFQASLGTIWTDWMGDVVPEEKRGRFFGRRMGVVGIVGMIANLGMGWFLDWAQAPFSFQLVIVMAVVFAMLAALLLLLHHDPPKEKEIFNLAQVFSLPWREANFRKFLLFAGYFHVGIFLSAALITVYFLQELNMTFSQLALWTVIASLTGLVSTDLWGRLADRIGNRTVMLCSLIIMGIGFPTTWILADLQDSLNYIWLSAVIDAVAWGAGGPALFNLALVSAPKNKRLSYIALYSFITGLMGFLGGALSGPIFTFLSQYNWGRWNGYHSLFAISGFIRLSSALLLLRVKETKKWDPMPLLKTLRAWQRLGFPWR